MRIDFIWFTPEGGWWVCIDDEVRRYDDISRLPRELLREAVRTRDPDARRRLLETHSSIKPLAEEL